MLPDVLRSLSSINDASFNTDSTSNVIKIRDDLKDNMEPILIPRPPVSSITDSLISNRRATKLRRPTYSVPLSQNESIPWGRHHHSSWLHTLECTGIILLCPCLVIFYWISMSTYSGSLTAAIVGMCKVGPVAWFSTYFPQSSMKANFGYSAWVLFQVALYQYLPTKLSTGQLTPAGNLLLYRTNGLTAWVVTHAIYLTLSYYNVIDAAILATNWEYLLVSVNIYGYLLTMFAFVKAHIAPTHEWDRKFSGSLLYDFYMGIELNPRIGKHFDFKLFHNGRPGIVAWTLIDLSFVSYQYHVHGFITNSIIIATFLHTIYVVDFFANEDWYVRTIDIAHDHFGFYLAWGSMVWLPTMYTLQTQYLARNPIGLSSIGAVITTCTGVGGYILFRWVNYQKDIARRTKGECNIWGKKAKVHIIKYKTTDGLEHESLLLVSGWWGIARHMNYLGDLILSYSMCACCGWKNLLPWTYAIYMTILLVHRCWRDEERCSQKYGKGWEKYCQLVRWRILPGVW